jgi:hypothetical protein
VGGGDSSAGLQKDAAAYDPATHNWTRLPNAPIGFEGNGTAPDIWTGASVITIEDAVPGGRPLSLDLTTRSWSLGPKAPVPGRQKAHESWTRSEVLVWGGGFPSATPAASHQDRILLLAVGPGGRPCPIPRQEPHRPPATAVRHTFPPIKQATEQVVMCLCVTPRAGTQIRPYEVTAAITAFTPAHTHLAAGALCSVGNCAFGGPRRRTWRSCSGNRLGRV